MTRAPFYRRGITLVELMVVMAIISMIMGLGAYAMDSVGGSEIRNDAMRLASVIKYTHSNACINNTRYRVVFQMGSGEYYSEITDAPVLPTDSAGDDEFLTEEAKALAEEKEKENDLFDDDEANPFGVNRKVSYQRVEDIIIKETRLSEGVHFEKFYSPKFPDDPITEGKAAMSFFPNGFQEQVMIVIKDDDGQVYSLVTEPLTGRVEIFSDEIDVPDEFGEVEDDD